MDTYEYICIICLVDIDTWKIGIDTGNPNKISDGKELGQILIYTVKIRMTDLEAVLIYSQT